MRNSATHHSKHLAKELSTLRAQLDELAGTVQGTGTGLVARGENAVEDTLRSARDLVAKYGDTAKSVVQDTAKLKNRAAGRLIEYSEARPFTTLAAIVGIGFFAGWLSRRR